MKKEGGNIAGHIQAISAICIWGSTFIFSKELLTVYTPLQIMLMRFITAYAILWCMYPKNEKTTPRDNLYLLGMSLLAQTLYFIFENNALRYTLTSNVSIIVATAPMLTALLMHLFRKDTHISKNAASGFLLAFAGVALVVFNGTVVLKFNPLGDILSLGAALTWAFYSIGIAGVVHRFSSFFLMRRMTFFALITILPVIFLKGEAELPIEYLADPFRLFCVLFLGVLGSGVTYVVWNMATKNLGIIGVSSYIYFNPFVTMVVAAIFLNEPITPMGVIGALLIIGGVVLSARNTVSVPEKGTCK